MIAHLRLIYNRLRLNALMDTMASRLVVMLTIGMVGASVASLLVAERLRVQAFERVRLENIVASVMDVSARTLRDPAGTAALLRTNHIFGIREAPPQWTSMNPERRLGKMLTAQLGPGSNAQGMPMPQTVCYYNWDLTIRAAGMANPSLPDCWYVKFLDANGVQQRLAVDVLSVHVPQNATLAPLFLALIAVACTIVAFVVARVATAPLRSLSKGARAFSVTIDPEPIPEHGPAEVRAALQTFNVMQQRVREGFRDRTHILASIAHDLQTPLTRLRLRVEQVADEQLRARLVADLAVTQQLVRDGLDLARSSESREPWSVADIDSILSSIAEDAAEFGHNVRFACGCAAQARIKPNALVRCLNNLVENAIRYAGTAELSSVREGGALRIHVRDHGPGIPETAAERVLEPFSRLDGRPAAWGIGTGIGLTIARAQAMTFGATLSLRNHDQGGLVATISFGVA